MEGTQQKPLPETNLQEAYKLLYNFDSASRKDAQISRDKIEILKQWAESEEDILPNLTDAQFGLFLHSVYGDVDAAKDCLLTFFRFAIRVPQFFDHWDVSLDKIKQGLECAYYAPLPKLSPRNHAMMYCGYRSSDASKYHFSDGVRLFSMMVEAALLTRGPQEGICVILDMSAMTLSHMWRFPLPLLRKFIEMVQEGLPVRLKEIHITNASYFLPTLLSLVRPFMKKELAEMIQCHSGGMASFYEQFPRDTLPKELGGTLCEAMKYHNDNVKLCAEFAPMWQERENWTNQRRRLKEIKV